MFWSGLHIVVSKSCNFQSSGYVLVRLTRCGFENMLFSGTEVCSDRAYTLWCRKVVIFRPRVVFGSSLHVGVSKRSNFVASSCVWVGLTCGSVEKEYFPGLGLCLGRAYRWRCRRSNFHASDCVWVGLTRCGVEKL